MLNQVPILPWILQENTSTYVRVIPFVCFILLAFIMTGVLIGGPVFGQTQNREVSRPSVILLVSDDPRIVKYSHE